MTPETEITVENLIKNMSVAENFYGFFDKSTNFNKNDTKSMNMPPPFSGNPKTQNNNPTVIQYSKEDVMSADILAVDKNGCLDLGSNYGDLFAILPQDNGDILLSNVGKSQMIKAWVFKDKEIANSINEETRDFQGQRIEIMHNSELYPFYDDEPDLF